MYIDNKPLCYTPEAYIMLYVNCILITKDDLPKITRHRRTYLVYLQLIVVQMNQNCAYHLYECIFTGKISVEKLTP